MPFGSLHSPFLGAESHITQAAFYSQCKNLEGNKIHQSSAWFSKSLPHCSSFPVALQLELFDSLLVRIFNPVAFYLDCCGPNLPNPWSLFLVPGKDLHSHLWSLLPLLKQQRAFYKVMYITHVLVRCSLAYSESHRTAQMNLKGFRMQGTVVKIRLGYSQKQGWKVGSSAYDSFSAYSKHVHLEILAAVPHADYSLQVPCTVLPLGVWMKHRNALSPPLSQNN